MVQTNKRPVGRFAPTPSGRLHLGNLACALVAYLSVAARGGALRLRIEDLDAARCAAMEENTRWLLDDLSYFGIPFEGEVLYQSRRTEIYEQAFNKLKEKGLIYPCYCSRAELHAATAPNRGDAAPVYDRRCLLHPPKVLPARPPAYRVRVPAGRIGFTDRVFGAYSEEPERDCGSPRARGMVAWRVSARPIPIPGRCWVRWRRRWGFCPRPNRFRFPIWSGNFLPIRSAGKRSGFPPDSFPETAVLRRKNFPRIFKKGLTFQRAFSIIYPLLRESGGTGRRARLRGVWIFPYGFKSRFSHQQQKGIRKGALLTLIYEGLEAVGSE